MVHIAYTCVLRSPTMAISSVHYSSTTDQWATPIALFDRLDKEFRFTLDVCASPHNAKCARYFSPETNGLLQPWSGVCWCNPPYGRSIGKWVAKAARSAQDGATVVCLLPARTDTQWFHDHCYSREVRFLRGRLYFGDGAGRAPFPSMVVVLRPDADDAAWLEP